MSKTKTDNHDSKSTAVIAPVTQSKVPHDAPTEDSLLAEAIALGSAFSTVTSHPADLIADAEELLKARGDASDLMKRKYRVTAGMFTRVELLMRLINAGIAAQGRQVEASKAKTASADAARARLIVLRGQLAGIAKAAGIPAPLFSLDTKNTARLNVVMMKMEEVLDNVAAYREHMPDLERVDALVAEARKLIAEQKETRTDARLMRAGTSSDSLRQAQYIRLLMDVLQHLSNQGLAAYPDDAVREPLYRLDHVYGGKVSKVVDPGANDGTEPQPEINPGLESPA